MRAPLLFSIDGFALLCKHRPAAQTGDTVEALRMVWRLSMIGRVRFRGIARLSLMECLVLFSLVNFVLNQTNQPENTRIGRLDSETQAGAEKDLSISDKILSILNSEEFLYIFVGVLVLIVIAYACSTYCRQTPSLEHLTDDCDKLADRNSYKSIRNIKKFFANTLLNFNNIDEQVAKEQEIKSIDSLTSKNTSKSQSKSRHQSNQRPLIMHQKSSKSSSVFSKSDTNTPLRLKINMVKGEKKGSNYLAPKKSKAPASMCSSGSFLGE